MSARTACVHTGPLKSGRVYFLSERRRVGGAPGAEALLDFSLAHPDVIATELAVHSSENTAKTSALVGAVKTLLAITAAVTSRSYVVAAARTSESGKSAASIAAHLALNSATRSFLVMGALDVIEVCSDSGL